jgi:tetratricopeptide (TPR) repeat protein
MSPRPLAPPHSEFDTAVDHARAGRFREALAESRRTLAGDDGEPRAIAAANALLTTARLAEVAGEPGLMLEALDLALACRGRWADLHFARARACLALGRRADAREALEAALAINPRYAAARVERALLDARLGLVGEALEALRALGAESRPADPRLFEHGLASLEHGDWDEARTRLKRALRLGEPELEFRLARFHELLEAGDAARAAQTLREALPRFEGYPDLHALIGLADLHQGHFDDALAALARALEINPDFHAARVRLARALDGVGARAQAQEQLALVLLAEPGHPEAVALAAEWAPRSSRSRAREKSVRKAS